MLIKIPTNTTELYKKLKEETDKLSPKERNAFVLDLVKFCIDWQFAMIALKEVEDDTH